MKLLTIPFLTLVFLVGSLNETQAQSACEDLAGNTAYQELAAEGVVLVKGSSYDEAMERFTAAQKICPFDPGVTYYMARTKHLSGDCEMALFLYDQTLAHLSAGLVASGVTVADVEKRRNEECVAAAPPSLVAVSIRCADVGVTLVFEDGRKEKCPFDGELTPGAWALSAQLANHESKALSVTVVKGQATSVEVTRLTELSGRLVLVCDSPLAAVKVNGGGKVQDVACPGERVLTVGEYKVMDPWGGESQRVDVYSGAETRLVLTKPVATVVVQKNGDARSEKATDGSGSATLGWVAVGVGAALVGTGVALTLVAKGERSEVNQARWLWHEGYPVTIGLTQAEAEAKMTSANTLEGVGWTAVGLGGAAVVTGVVLLLSDEGNAESDVSATWWGAGGAVVWTGRF